MQSAPRSAGASTCIELLAARRRRGTSSPGRISRSKRAPIRSSAHVSEATTGSSPSRPSTSGRKPCAVAEREQRARRRGRRSTRRPRAAPSSPAIASASGRSSFAISAATISLSEVDAKRVAELGAQLVGVDQVAVVAERDRARAAVVEQRLRVRPRVRAGGRVARVADRELAAQARQASSRRTPA